MIDKYSNTQKVADYISRHLIITFPLRFDGKIGKYGIAPAATTTTAAQRLLPRAALCLFTMFSADRF